MSVTAPPPSDAEPERPQGHVPDPVVGGINDDVLFTKPARMALGERHPNGLRVLDWPELRALFGRHDAPANSNRRRDRMIGLSSIAAAATGLSLAAFAPLAGSGAALVGAAGAVFALCGAGLALFHLLDAGSKARWLGNRYWTERVRGLYFQVIVNNLDLVARAMADDRALAEWKMERARALLALPHPEDVPGQIERLAGNVADGETWVLPDWERPTAPPPPSRELDLLLGLLRAQRFDVQLAYTDSKLGASLAPKRRSQAVRIGSDILPSVAVIAAAAGGLLLASGAPAESALVRLTLGLAATATAIALSLRMINANLLLSADAGRYAWYGAAVLRARTRFDAGDLGEKVAALREMEVVAYRDLREFVAAHWRSRNVI